MSSDANKPNVFTEDNSIPIDTGNYTFWVSVIFKYVKNTTFRVHVLSQAVLTNFRLWNDLYFVGWGVKLYSTHSPIDFH